MDVGVVLNAKVEDMTKIDWNKYLTVVFLKEFLKEIYARRQHERMAAFIRIDYVLKYILREYKSLESYLIEYFCAMLCAVEFRSDKEDQTVSIPNMLRGIRFDSNRNFELIAQMVAQDISYYEKYSNVLLNIDSSFDVAVYMLLHYYRTNNYDMFKKYMPREISSNKPAYEYLAALIIKKEKIKYLKPLVQMLKTSKRLWNVSIAYYIDSFEPNSGECLWYFFRHIGLPEWNDKWSKLCGKAIMAHPLTSFVLECKEAFDA